MYMEYLFYLKTLPEGERIEQILLISAVLVGLFLVGIGIEIFQKKYSKQYANIKKFFNKLNIFRKKETKKGV